MLLLQNLSLHFPLLLLHSVVEVPVLLSVQSGVKLNSGLLNVGLEDLSKVLLLLVGALPLLNLNLAFSQSEPHENFGIHWLLCFEH